MSVFWASLGFGIVTASILAIAAVGFTLQFGATNIFNLAYGDTMTAAAFVGYLATRANLGLWAAMIAGGAFGGAFSVLLNRAVYAPFIRRGTRLFCMIIVSIAVSLILSNGLQAIWGANFYSLAISPGRSFKFGPFIMTAVQLIIIAIAVAIMIVVHVLLRHTQLGRAMRATANNATLARNCGIRTDLVIDMVWLLSGTLCGVGGVALMANITSFDFGTGGQFIVLILTAAVLGGVGQPYGAMLGALVIGVASEVSAAVISPEYKELVAFVILVLILLIRPQGILSEVAAQKEVVVG
jgi:branched-chain amino acid transport system permease protein/neutral amino acid transport system permease protein